MAKRTQTLVNEFEDLGHARARLVDAIYAIQDSGHTDHGAVAKLEAELESARAKTDVLLAEIRSRRAYGHFDRSLYL